MKVLKLRKTSIGYCIIGPNGNILTDYKYFGERYKDAWDWANVWISSFQDYTIVWESKQDKQIFEKQFIKLVK